MVSSDVMWTNGEMNRDITCESERRWGHRNEGYSYWDRGGFDLYFDSSKLRELERLQLPIYR